MESKYNLHTIKEKLNIYNKMLISLCTRGWGYLSPIHLWVEIQWCRLGNSATHTPCYHASQQAPFTCTFASACAQICTAVHLNWWRSCDIMFAHLWPSIIVFPSGYFWRKIYKGVSMQKATPKEAQYSGMNLLFCSSSSHYARIQVAVGTGVLI